MLDKYDIISDIRKSSIEDGIGGPFGAIVFKEGEIVGKGVNSVIGNNDPTAHAEIMAIRDACRNLKTYDLTGCELYATGYPCPMCMSAIIWANIKKVYYSADYNDAKQLGFRDDFIYNFLKSGCKDTDVLQLEPVDKTAILDLYKEYKYANRKIY